MIIGLNIQQHHNYNTIQYNTAFFLKGWLGPNLSLRTADSLQSQW